MWGGHEFRVERECKCKYYLCQRHVPRMTCKGAPSLIQSSTAKRSLALSRESVSRCRGEGKDGRRGVTDGGGRSVKPVVRIDGGGNTNRRGVPSVCVFFF